MFNGFDGAERTTARLKVVNPVIPEYPAFREHLLGFGVSRAFPSRYEGQGTLRGNTSVDDIVLAYEHAQHHGCVLKNLTTLEEFTASTYFVKYQDVLTPVQRLRRLDPSNPAYRGLTISTTPSTIQRLPVLDESPSIEALRRLLHYTTRE